LRARNNDSTVLLDAGDQYQGTFWFNVHRANITAHFMKKLGYDAMVGRDARVVTLQLSPD